MGEILAVFSAFFYGASNIYVNQGIVEEKLNNYEGLFLSLLVNNILNFLILPFYLIFISLPSYNFIGLFSYAIAGVLTSFLARILLFACIERIKASRASVLKITAPVFTVIFGVTVLNENVNIYELLGIVIVLVGVFVISWDSNRLTKNDVIDIDENKTSCSSLLSSRTLKIGIILGILAGLSLGSGNIFRKLGTDFYGNPFIGVLIGSLVSISLVVISSIFTDKIDLSKVFKKTTISRSYFIVGLWYSLATYSIFIALDYAPVSIVNALSSTQPFFALILSTLILKKEDLITLMLVIGSIIVIAGSALIFIF